MNNNRIAQFYKVSFEQFLGDYIEIFGLKPEAYEMEMIRNIHDNINVPMRATKDSAGYDFRCPFDIELFPGDSIKIPTGIRCKIDEGWMLMLCPRSSLGFKYRIQLDNTMGIIDGDYFNSSNEGHIIAKIHNGSKENKVVKIKKGDNFIQGIFMPYGITIDDNAVGARNGGFGSTDR